jgi:ubiquinone/menaquinone biosynthesis C-methylase UbiE
LYSADYVHRVCLDLSERALKEARGKLGSHGLYVMGDVTNLPFREGTFDAILVSHVLYHIPDDEQANTVLELYSTLKDGGTCLIIYYWQSCFISTAGELLKRFFT